MSRMKDNFAGAMVRCIAILALFWATPVFAAEVEQRISMTMRDADLFNLHTCDSISVIRFDGVLYFANTGFFEDMVLERAESPKLRGRSQQLLLELRSTELPRNEGG